MLQFSMLWYALLGSRNNDKLCVSCEIFCALSDRLVKMHQNVTHLFLFILFPPCNFQEVETGEHGTSGVCALRRVIQVGSVAFECVKAQEFRITPVMARGRKCAPAMTRSAQVCVCVCPYMCVYPCS